jgi:hypothetical protein
MRCGQFKLDSKKNKIDETWFIWKVIQTGRTSTNNNLLFPLKKNKIIIIIIIMIIIK